MMRNYYLLLVMLVLHSQVMPQNYCMYFSGADKGSNNNVQIPALNLPSLPVTIEAWFKPDGQQNDYSSIIFSRSGSSTPTGIFIRPTYNNELRSVWANAQSTMSTPLIVTNNVWHHVALVVTATAKSLYLDGVLYSYTVTSNALETFDTPILIGWDDVFESRMFKGYIDEVRIWTSARTPQQLEDTRYGTLSGTEAGLVGYWRFDDRSAKATDYSSNGHEGTINGAVYVNSDVFSPMVFQSATAWQQSDDVMKGATDRPVLRIRVNTENKSLPLVLTGVDISVLGSSRCADIAAVKLYYTGTDSLFSNAQLFGTYSGDISTDIMTISGHQKMSAGANYLWVAYDISNAAGEGDVIDAECRALLFNGTSAVPSPQSPAGALNVNSSLFMPHAKIGAEVVSSLAATPSGGANFVSFQQDAIASYNGYQYITYWNTAYHVCIARKKMPHGTWETLELADYTVTAARVADNHYNISMGICPKDGTIHIAFDHHGDRLHYRVSVAGLASRPEMFQWESRLFGPVRGYLVAGSIIDPVTYPRFIAKPDGDLLFECRLGTSGGGDNYLWEYNASSAAWQSIGKYADGLSLDPDQNAYINGMQYDRGGRLHCSWVWRMTPDPVTNHDIYYTYSDDHGRTWKNCLGSTVGQVNSNPLSLNTTGLKIYTVNQNRGLINQESQTVDSKGGIHILQSFMLDKEADAANNFWGSRNKAFIRHIYYDNESGKWNCDIVPAVSRNRSQIAIDRHDNLYIVTSDCRIYFASAANKWQKWTEFDNASKQTVINEGLIDRQALLRDDVLTFVFAQEGNKIIVPYYLLENTDRGNGTGLRGAYYNDTVFSAFSFQNLDSLNFAWGNARAFAGVSAGMFSAEWKGYVETQYAEQYTLYVSTSAGVRMWVNDNLVLDHPQNVSEREFSCRLPLIASHRYQIRIEAVFRGQATGMKLEWQSAKQPRAVVPRMQLYGTEYLRSLECRDVLELEQGWNLVTMTGHPQTPEIAELLPNAPVAKTMQSVYRRNQAPFLNHLSQLEAGKAYLVYMDRPETIQVTGVLNTPILPTHLQKGWNLLAYPLVSPMPVSLLPISCPYEIIKDFKSFYMPTGSVNSLEILEPSKAYFIKVDTECWVEW